MEPSDEWLRTTNDSYRQQDIIPGQRPWLAWRDYSMLTKTALEIRDPIVVRIFAWFRDNTAEKSGKLGPFYRGAFFYDGCFWPVNLPRFYGTVQLEVLAALTTMRDAIKAPLVEDQQALNTLSNVWHACMSYALGFEQLPWKSLPPFPRDLVLSAHRQLISAIALLLSDRPTAAAAQACAFTVEIYGKAVLALKAGLTDQQAKRLGHGLSIVLERCRPYLVTSEFIEYANRVKQLPDPNDRYAGDELPYRNLWEAYYTAQTFAAVAVATLAAPTR